MDSGGCVVPVDSVLFVVVFAFVSFAQEVHAVVLSACKRKILSNSVQVSFLQEHPTNLTVNTFHGDTFLC